jgi:DNA modification methylase
MRYQAALALGLKKVPCIVVSIPRDQEALWNIKDNNQYGRWDTQKTMDMLVAMERRGQDLALTGFDDRTIDTLLNQNNLLLSKEDQEGDLAQELAKIKKPKSKQGAIYNLGDHVLMCGDSTSRADIGKLMGKTKADVVFTDPPYNMDYKSSHLGKIKNDKMKEEEFEAFIRKAFQAMQPAMRSGATFYVCSGWGSYPVFYAELRNSGLTVVQAIVWEKNSAGIGWADYRHQYEMVIKGAKRSATQERKARGKKAETLIYGQKPGAKRVFFGTREEADVWKLPRKAASRMVHPTEKPTWLIKKALNMSSRRNAVVLDPFGGGGSTLIAAEATGRKARIMELEPKFCDIIRQRYEKYKRLN